MHNDRELSIVVPETASPARALRRVADSLGVSVSSFGSVEADTTLQDGPANSEESAVLATVRSYLKRANPAARDRFVAVVQTMVKLPSA